MTEPKASCTSQPPQERSAADRVRQTAQWLVASFGAVAAALLASLKLSDVGKLEGSTHAWALAGFGLGMVGVTIAIVAMAWVTGPRTTSLATVEGPDLRTIASHYDWLSGFGSVEELAKYYRGAATDRIDTYNRMADAVEKKDETALSEATAAHDLASRRLELVNPAVDRIVDHAADFVVRSSWRRALFAFVIGVALTSAGVGIFASETTKIRPISAAAATPTRVTVNLTGKATETYQERLGRGCDADDFQATALERSSGKTTVLVTDPRCQPVELSLAPADAEIRAPLGLPPPGTGPTSPIHP
jgi:hypothetical protein